MSCGGGTLMRSRDKQQIALHGGTECPGSDQESKSCNPQPCPGIKLKIDYTLYIRHLLKNIFLSQYSHIIFGAC